MKTDMLAEIFKESEIAQSEGVLARNPELNSEDISKSIQTNDERNALVKYTDNALKSLSIPSMMYDFNKFHCHAGLRDFDPQFMKERLISEYELNGLVVPKHTISRYLKAPLIVYFRNVFEYRYEIKYHPNVQSLNGMKKVFVLEIEGPLYN